MWLVVAVILNLCICVQKPDSFDVKGVLERFCRCPSLLQEHRFTGVNLLIYSQELQPSISTLIHHHLPGHTDFSSTTPPLKVIE